MAILITLMIIQDGILSTKRYELTGAHFWFGVNESILCLTDVAVGLCKTKTVRKHCSRCVMLDVHGIKTMAYFSNPTDSRQCSAIKKKGIDKTLK